MQHVRKFTSNFTTVNNYMFSSGCLMFPYHFFKVLIITESIVTCLLKCYKICLIVKLYFVCLHKLLSFLDIQVFSLLL